MNKQLIRTVNLRFFEEDANGEWGLTHDKTIDSDNGFNAFYDGIGIFHDVFEHWHEHEHEYFRGEYAMNIGGEMAAMGAAWYFVFGMHMWNRLDPNYGQYYTSQERIMTTTSSLVEEVISEGYCSYGDRLLCAVPKQKPAPDSEFELQLRHYYEHVRKVKPCKKNDDGSYGRQYKSSVTLGKIQSLHRWGLHTAMDQIPNTSENSDQLCDFIEYWKKFCKHNPPEEMAGMFQGIAFDIYREGLDVTWAARLRTDPNAPTEVDEETGEPYDMLCNIWIGDVPEGCSVGLMETVSK